MRQRRDALGLTRRELADCAGCSASALRKIETDERRPSRQLAELLAGCLQLPSEEKPLFVNAARGKRRTAQLGAPGTRPIPVPPWLAAGVSTVAPGGKTAPPPWNLPAAATPLVGREEELGKLAKLLEDPGCRLLTLVGPGGIGKTRLAIELSCNVWDRFVDGVYFAPLATTSSPSSIVPAIAKAAGITFGPTDARAELTNILAGKQALLLLDNLEHLLDGVDVLAELLAHAPALKLLVTSRERLELHGEWVFEVKGLAVPVAGPVKDPESYSAIQLFVQRARRARVDFQLSDEDSQEVVRICQLVEGVPLAIELAAAWVPVLSCTEIAHEIERGLDVLSTRQRDMPERQRSLRAVFDHSWTLLTEKQRSPLRQLSVLRDGFEREAAEVIAGATLPDLLELRDKSLLRRNAIDRYEVPEMIRQYAAEKLDESPGEKVGAETRHSTYYMELLHCHEAALGGGPSQKSALATIEADMENVRKAWHFALTHEEWDHINRGLEGLFHFFEMRGQLQAGAEVFQQALDILSPRAHTHQQRIVRDTLLSRHGWFAYRLGQYERAQQDLEGSLAGFRALGVPGETAFALYNLAILAYQLGRYGEAEVSLQESLAIRRELGDRFGVASSLSILGIVARDQGKVEPAQVLLNESLAIYRELDERRGVSRCLNLLALIRRDMGDSEAARHMLQESLEFCRELDDRTGIAFATSILGAILYGLGDYVAAENLSRESLEIREDIGDRRGSAFALHDLGNVAVAMEKYDVAHRYYHRALQMAVDVQAIPVALCVIIGFASLKAAEGQPAESLRLALFVENSGSSFEKADERAGKLRMQLEARLPATSLAQVYDAASVANFEDVVRRLLAEE